ncbi:MAG: hypothetical protein LBR80_02495 [Deltaproteobacteria bacterium]|jgi:hypothetical protein|nr:hypothetical protein [Deltaproteobacteria bacterium]
MTGRDAIAGTLPAECLDAVDLGGVFRNSEVRAATPYDVPGINAEARRAFAKRLAELAGSHGGTRSRIMPVLAPAGAGKTHLLMEFCRKTTEAGGVFVPADLTDIDLFWRESCRASAQALLSDGPDGVPCYVRLVHALLMSAGFNSVPPDPDSLSTWLLETDADDLRKMLNNLVRKLASALTGTAPFWGDAARCVFGLSSDDRAVLHAASAWLSAGEADESSARALELENTAPGPDAAFFAVNSLIAATGGFTVVAYDQLDRIISHAEGDRQPKADELTRRLARVQGESRRTLCVVTSLADVWSHMSHAVTRLRLGIFEKRIPLSPLTEPDLMEELIAARMGPAFREAPGFKPPYPSYPFPRAFFEPLRGKFARDVIRAARAHVVRCSDLGTVSEWSPEGELRAAGPDSVQSAGFPYISVRLGTAREKAKGRIPKDGADMDIWQEALDAVCACYAAEAAQGLSETERPVCVPRSPLRKLVPLTFSTLERRGGGTSARRLVLCIIPHSNPIAFQNRLMLAILEAAPSARGEGSRRIVVLRGTPLPKGPQTRKKFEYFLEEGGVSAGFDGDAGSLMLAILEISKIYPDKWKEWATAEKPVTVSGFLKDDFLWLSDINDA